MSNEVAIICSRTDPASLNIAERFLELEAWTDRDGYKSSGSKALVIHEEKQTALQGFDARLKDLGLRPKMVVFASRHVSKSGLPWLGGHFTGIFENCERKLSMAAPAGLWSFLQNISRLAPEGFRISAEATHHGPTDTETPSFFAEIGSSEPLWRDPCAGEAVARAILALEIKDHPVALGFGGGHYVQRQTDLMLETEVAFGHLFSSYQIGALDAELVEEARRKSGASFAYLDRKSFRSEDKKRALRILDEVGLPVLQSKEIRAKFPAFGEE